MTCEHAATTVLLYLFGEAPDGYEEHLAACDECQESLSRHAATVRAVDPVLGPGGAADVSAPSLEPRRIVPTPPATARQVDAQIHRTRTLPWLVAAAAAATLALAVARWPAQPGMVEDQDAAADAVTPGRIEPEPWTDPIELELDDIAGEFDSLIRDMEEP